MAPRGHVGHHAPAERRLTAFLAACLAATPLPAASAGTTSFQQSAPRSQRTAASLFSSAEPLLAPSRWIAAARGTLRPLPPIVAGRVGPWLREYGRGSAQCHRGRSHIRSAPRDRA